MNECKQMRMYIIAKIDGIENLFKFCEDNKIRRMLLKEEVQLETYKDLLHFINSMQNLK